MASDINAKEDRYPWISWAMTGVLTLAVVLAVGLVIRAQHPPAQRGAQAALPKGTSPAQSGAGAPAAASLTGAKVPRTSAVPPVRQLVSSGDGSGTGQRSPWDSQPTSPATPHVAPGSRRSRRSLKPNRRQPNRTRFNRRRQFNQHLTLPNERPMSRWWPMSGTNGPA